MYPSYETMDKIIGSVFNYLSHQHACLKSNNLLNPAMEESFMQFVLEIANWNMEKNKSLTATTPLSSTSFQQNLSPPPQKRIRQVSEDLPQFDKRSNVPMPQDNVDNTLQAQSNGLETSSMLQNKNCNMNEKITSPIRMQQNQNSNSLFIVENGMRKSFAEEIASENVSERNETKAEVVDISEINNGLLDEIGFVHHTEPQEKQNRKPNKNKSKPFHKSSSTCKICNLSLANQSTLKTHMLIHTGEKNYQCQICSKSFRHRPSLVNHIRLHTGEKPYKCDFCDDSFIQYVSLKYHLQKKHPNRSVPKSNR